MKFIDGDTGYFTFGVFCLMIICGLVYASRHFIAENKGTLVKAVVIAIPDKYTRRSNLQVQYLDGTYDLRISQSGCEEGIYKKGDSVTVSYYKPYDILSWPGDNGGKQLLAGIFMLVIIVGAAQFFHQTKKQKEEAHHAARGFSPGCLPGKGES